MQKKIIFIFIISNLLFSIGAAANMFSLTGAQKLRKPASDMTIEEFQKLREDPEVKKGVKVLLEQFEKSGTALLCSTVRDIDHNVALVFWGVRYSIRHMATVPAHKDGSGQVCIAIEKPNS